jgi:hypothetical protein
MAGRFPAQVGSGKQRRRAGSCSAITHTSAKDGALNTQPQTRGKATMTTLVVACSEHAEHRAVIKSAEIQRLARASEVARRMKRLDLIEILDYELRIRYSIPDQTFGPIG